MIVAYGLGKDTTAKSYVPSFGFGAFFTGGLTLSQLLCVVQSIRIIEPVQRIEACELGRRYNT